MAVAAASGGANRWQQMLRDCSVRTRLPQATLLLVGDAQSGKTALLSRLNQHGAAAGGAAAAGDAGDDANDSLLAFSTINVVDPKVGGDAAGNANVLFMIEYLETDCGVNAVEANERLIRGECGADDVMAKIGTWTLNELKLKELMRIAIKPHELAQVWSFPSELWAF
jgi:hypothetical protein